MARSKHGFFLFPPKKALIWRRHCSIGQSCCSMKSKRSIGWFLESSRAWLFLTRSLNQPKATRGCIRSINQLNRSISVRLGNSATMATRQQGNKATGATRQQRQQRQQRNRITRATGATRQQDKKATAATGQQGNRVTRATGATGQQGNRVTRATG